MIKVLNMQHSIRAALTDCDGTQYSVEEVHSATHALSNHPALTTIGGGSRVAILLEKSFASLICIYATQELSAAYIPIDPHSPEARIRTILSDSDSHVVIHDRPHFFGNLKSTRLDIPGLENLFVTELSRPDYDFEKQPTNTFDKCISYVLYTSGSTGVPKGVCVAHTAANAFVRWCVKTFGINETDEIASIAPFHFDLSVCDVFASRFSKANLHLFNTGQVQNVRLMAEELSRRKITFIYATPTFLSALVQFGKTEKYDWTSMKTVLFAGEVFPVKHLHALMDVWNGARFYNLYGPTETNVCTYYEVEHDETRTEPYPIGRPCTFHELEITEEGELLVGGAHIADGYMNNPELTNEKFFMRSAVRWFRTGDRVALDENNQLIFKGRIDRMVKRRGYRIEPAEIEIALGNISGISGCAVVTHERDGSVQLTAVITTNNRTIDILELKTKLAEFLPDYMLPDSVLTIQEFPKTSSGKIDYVKLRQEVVSSM